MSPYYGQLTRNTPILITINAGNGAYRAVEMFVSEWPARWDKSGNDAYVPIKCGGILRRLGQGNVLRSPVRRYYDRTSVRPLAYWPLEDEENATTGASAVVGVAAMSASGGSSSSGGVKFTGTQGRTQAAYTGYEIAEVGTKPLASLNDGGTLYGRMPAGTSSPIEWTVKFLCRASAYTGASFSDIVIARWFTPGGTYVKWEIIQRSSTGYPEVVVYDAADTPTSILQILQRAPDLMEYAVSARQSGTDMVTSLGIRRALVEDIVVGAFGSNTGDTRAATLARPTEIYANPNKSSVPSGSVSGFENLTNDFVFGHLTVWDTYAPPTATEGTIDFYTRKNITSWAGFAGEHAIARITRLCAEEGIRFQVTGWVWNMGSAAVGIQGTGTFLDVLREAEKADGGVLHEQGFGLGYQPQIARYNALVGMTLDFDNDEVAEPPEPTDDDQTLHNSWTITRDGGSSATVTNETSIASDGRFESSETLKLYNDSQPLQVASWRVHHHTNPEYRWPSISLNFAASPELIEQWTQLPFGARIQVSNPPSQALTDPVDAFIEGKTEFFRPDFWATAMNTTPALPYEVHQVEALGNRGRVDSDITTLHADANSTTTSIVIEVPTTDGPFWRSGAVNFDIGVGGERMTVTNIGAPSGTTQTFTVVRSVNGVVKAQTAGTKVRLWRPGVVAV